MENVSTDQQIKPPRIVRVVIYLRQSLDAKDDRAAVQRQLKACERWCAERSTPEVTYTVVKVYEDNDTSATKGVRKRKAFTQMLADAKAGQFDLIAAYHLDRLTRTIRDLLPLLELATKHSVGTTTVSGDIDLNTDMGRLVAGILAVVAQAEVDRKSARQVLANGARAEAGDPHIGGARPIGYDRVVRGKHDQNEPKLAIREDEAKHIRQAYTDVLAGRSCSAIARDLNAAGLRTTKLATKREGTFTHQSVRQLLCNPLYAGLKVYKGEIVRAGNWERIVDEDVWRTVRAKLTDPDRRSNLNAGGTRRWVGTGIYRCGVCAADGVDETLVTGYRDDKQRIYMCRTSKHLTRVADLIDQHVVDSLCDRFDQADAASLLIDHDRPDMGALHAEEERLLARIDQATNEFTDDPDVSPAQLRKITARLRTQLEAVQESMTHTDRSALLAGIIHADDSRAYWDELTVDRQREILASVLAVTIRRGRAGGNSRNGPRPLDHATVDLRWLV